MGLTAPAPLEPTPTAAPADRAPPAPPADDAYRRFVAELLKTCDVPRDLGTTAGMVDQQRAIERCADRRLKAVVASLPARSKEALIAPPEPRREVESDWHPAWNRFAATACYVEDALDWNAGTRRLGGTMRWISLAGCDARNAIEALYWVSELAKSDAAAAHRFADHLRARAADDGAEQMLAVLEREAAFEEARAPEDAIWDDGCLHFCRLHDSDWRKLRDNLQAVKVAAPALGSAMCRGWPELSRDFDGVDRCTETATRFLIALAAGGYVASDTDSDSYYLGLSEDDRRHEGADEGPPPMDEVYAHFARPIYARCERSPNHDVVMVDERTACHDAILHEELTRFGEVARQWRAFRDDLCLVESVATQSLYTTGSRMRSFGEASCGWLAATRGAFIGWMIANDDVDGFRAHMAHRAPWSDSVSRGLETFRGLTRRSWVDPARFLAASRAAAAIVPNARALATSICRAWPGLDAALGDCVVETTHHLLSYGHAIATVEDS